MRTAAVALFSPSWKRSVSLNFTRSLKMSRYSQYGNDRGSGDRYDRFANYSGREESYSSDQRYDEHYGRSRSSNDGSNMRSYESRRGGVGSGMGTGGGGRLGSNYDRDYRQQSRGRDDRRSDGSGGSFRGGYLQISSGGLLGASPNDAPSAPPPGNTTQHQVLAAIQAQQTQSLLAAIQAQQLNNMGPPSLLPTPGQGMARQHDNRGQQRQYGNRQRQYQQQPKRRNQQQESGPLAKRKRDDSSSRSFNRSDQQQKGNWKAHKSQGQGKLQGQNKSRSQSQNRKLDSSAPKDKNLIRAEGEEEDVYEIHDEEKDTQAEAEDLEGVEIDPELISKVEELRKRTKIDRNIADQDVDKLAVFHFNGEFYICKLCKIVTKSHKSMKQHLMGKKHSLNVIEARQAGNDVDRDISDIVLHPENWLELNPVAKTLLKRQTLGFMEAKRKEEEEFRYKHPENFLTYRLDTRKSAMKDGDTVTITSVCEANIAIKGFEDEKQLFGCEFIKATTGFNCRLCNISMNTGESVIDHIKTDEHMGNYKKQLERHGGYHEKLVQRNKEIVGMLDLHEGQEVVMYQSLEDETEKQKNIQRRYIRADDPAFIHIEKDMREMSTGKEDYSNETNEANAEAGEEVQVENEVNQQENEEVAGEQEELGNVLGDDGEELVFSGGESVLEEGEVMDGNGEGQVEESENHDQEMEQQDLETGEEHAVIEDEGQDLYEPSDPTCEDETEPAESGEPQPEPVQEPEPEPEPAPEPESKPVMEKFSAVKNEDEKPGKLAPKKKAPATKGNNQKKFAMPNTGKMARGRGGKPMQRSTRGGRVSQRSPKVPKRIEESFELVDEVGDGDE